jgi:hypothetical protein
MAQPIFHCLPNLVRGMPIFLLILAFAEDMPTVRFQENENAYFLPIMPSFGDDYTLTSYHLKKNYAFLGILGSQLTGASKRWYIRANRLDNGGILFQKPLKGGIAIAETSIPELRPHLRRDRALRALPRAALPRDGGQGHAPENLARGKPRPARVDLSRSREAASCSIPCGAWAAVAATTGRSPGVFGWGF